VKVRQVLRNTKAELARHTESRYATMVKKFSQAGTPDTAPKAAQNTGQAGWYHGESPFAPDGEDFFI